MSGTAEFRNQLMEQIWRYADGHTGAANAVLRMSEMQGLAQLVNAAASDWADPTPYIEAVNKSYLALHSSVIAWAAEQAKPR